MRFHHGQRGRGNGELLRRASWRSGRSGIEALGVPSVEVFAYFNNDWNGYAVRNGLWLRRAAGRLGLRSGGWSRNARQILKALEQVIDPS